MRKLYITILFLISLLLGIFHHSIIYASHHVVHHNDNQSTYEESNHHTHHNHSDINHEGESDEDSIIGKGVNKIKGKILADILVVTKFDFTYFNIHSFDTKNLFKKEYPPYYYRHIKNYSYSDTIKIIKSNT